MVSTGWVGLGWAPADCEGVPVTLHGVEQFSWTAFGCQGVRVLGLPGCVVARWVWRVVEGGALGGLRPWVPGVQDGGSRVVGLSGASMYALSDGGQSIL